MPSSYPSNIYSPQGLTRWYVDTRTLTASTSSLPLLSTLQAPDQTTVQKFYHLSDRHMSLASCLLKYLFVHQTCRVPWDQVIISRTAAPHSRPCYIPVGRNKQSIHNDNGHSNEDTTQEICNIEFNVSHQASMVALAGCIIPPDCSTSLSTSDSPTPSPAIGPAPAPQIGIDITCTSERERRNSDSVPKTEAELHSFIDIFSEVFSARELQDMKTPPTPTPISSFSPSQQAERSGDVGQSNPDQLIRSINHRLRRFYTYWALKEAYIKMTGEALLAPWLRELEFRDVVAPEPQDAVGSSSAAAFGAPSTRTRIFLHGKDVGDVRMEVVALEHGYLFATAARGKGVGRDSIPVEEASGGKADSWAPFRAIDIENDIAPCARGECACLRS